MAKKTLPPQTQANQPGRESKMKPRPKSSAKKYSPAGKLKNKIAVITGGDSGIGKSAAVAFAKEGAHCVIIYLEETKDAQQTKKLIEKQGQKALLIQGDVGDSQFCQQAVDQIKKQFKRIDILVNNAAEQHEVKSIKDLTDNQLHKTFRTNIFSQFYMVRNALMIMPPGSSIINTASITAYQGHPTLIDYSSTKGAVVSFTRSLAISLAPDIRVNAIAPGPIWTPLIPASFEEEKVQSFGSNTLLGRPGQPDEIAPAYVYLASSDSSYMTGQVLHPNGGRIINS